MFKFVFYTDLATRLVAALEESIRGDTKCSLETFENYNQQIMIYSHSLLKTNVIIVFYPIKCHKTKINYS